MAALTLLDSEKVEKELLFWNFPGFAVGVSVHGETRLLEGYGLRDREEGLPMTPDSLGCIGSCSKSFTSAMIETLVDDGILDLDRPVRDYVSDFRMKDPEASEHVTLRDMLCHRTGLAAHDGMWPQYGTSRHDFLREIRYLTPAYPFRAGTEYSNVMYGAAGAIAEEVTGETWETLVTERILAPLGMTRTRLCPQEQRKDPNHAIGYFSADRHQDLQPMGILDMNVDAPAGNVYSCPSEMLRWLGMHLGRGYFAGKRVLSERGADEVHRGIVRNASYPWKFPELSEDVWYGLGWRNINYRGRLVIYHTGEVEGYCALQVFVPSLDACVIEQVNHHKPCAPFLFSQLFTILDRLIAEEEGKTAVAAASGTAAATPASTATARATAATTGKSAVSAAKFIDWPSRFHPYESKFGGAHYNWKVECMEGVDAVKEKLAGKAPLSHPLAEYIGTFKNPAYGKVSVTGGEESDTSGAATGVASAAPDAAGTDVTGAAAASFTLHFDGQTLPMEHLYYDTFRITGLKEDTIYLTIPLSYHYSDLTGAIDGLFLKLEPETLAEFFGKAE